MKAIQTRYGGCRFRSRLEARYAVLFDTLGIKWDYEPEGFEFPDGRRYLPDFWLHVPGKEGWGYWVEIKPLTPDAHEFELMKRVSKASGHHGWFLVGTPSDDSCAVAMTGRFINLNDAAPICACAPAPVTPQRFKDAVTAARSARFEFGDRA